MQAENCALAKLALVNRAVLVQLLVRRFRETISSAWGRSFPPFAPGSEVVDCAVIRSGFGIGCASLRGGDAEPRLPPLFRIA